MTSSALLLSVSVTLVVSAVGKGCADPAGLGEKISNHKEVFLPPASSADHAQWLHVISQWRDSCRAQIGYNGSIYEQPSLHWARYNFVQPQMHPWDRLLYNPTTGQYTVQTYLDDLNRRYGGIDSVLIWPTYPLLGLDDRNQFDLTAALPGGIKGLKTLVAQLHQHNVKVLWPFLAWDNFTRPDPLNRDDATRMAALIRDTNADGANADSAETDDNQTDHVFHMNRVFFDATVAAGRPAAWQAESGPSAATPTALNWQVMDIGYWGGMNGNYTGGGGGSWNFAPAVDKWKWMDPRRMTVISDRWATNKTNLIQHAYFNAVGVEAWEALWGSWNGIVQRDCEALRRTAHMLRYFGRLGFTQSAGWVPHTPMIQNETVFGSYWPIGEEGLWTVVNRGTETIDGPQLSVNAEEFDNDRNKFFDCYHGHQIFATQVAKGRLELSFEIGGLDFGCVFATANPERNGLEAFLEEMSTMTVLPLDNFSDKFTVLQQTMLPTAKVTNGSTAHSVPSEMVGLPAGSFTFESAGVEIEGKDNIGVDVQFPFESLPMRNHSHTLDMPPFLIDKYPVTCNDYQAYLIQSKYKPIDPHAWLDNWQWDPTSAVTPSLQPKLPRALEKMPVTYVSLSEAAAYCKWVGKRLPQTVEWQYAAQGNSSRRFPWGDVDDPACRPELSQGRTIPGARAVDAFGEECSSVFGVHDLVGNCWEYTSVFVDDHTRRVVLKGGSNYKPTYHPQAPNFNTADFYYPQARNDLRLHEVMFLMSDSFERAGTVGFRCVRDIGSAS